jgi:hypothetical protein
MQCTGSANLELAIPNWTPPVIDPTVENAASRGTKLHALFAEVVTQSARDAERLAEALTYVAAIRSQRRFKVLSEFTMTADWLESKPPTTADLVFYVKDEIHIFDLKTGVIKVEVVGNKQMLYYAATYATLAPKAAGVFVHIVQPWADNTEYTFVDTTELRVFMDEARRAEQEILAQSVTLTPGDACMFCEANPRGRGARGRPFCPVLMKMYYPDLLDEAAILEDE